MSRIRTIKPEFFTSESVVACTPLARLFYVSLWCEADRAGRLFWKPRTLKMRYFPADDVDIQTLGDELVEQGMIVIYEVDGQFYAEIPGFSKHQVINNREAESVLPARVLTRESGVATRARGREGKGRERKEEIMRPDADASHCSNSPGKPPGVDTKPGPPVDGNRTAEDHGDEREVDVDKVLFDAGIALLSPGRGDAPARAIVGRLRKNLGTGEALRLIVDAKGTTDPAAYLMAAEKRHIVAAKIRSKAGPGKEVKFLTDGRFYCYPYHYTADGRQELAI